MACGRNTGKAGDAACGSGIPKSVSTKTFYLAATAAGLLTMSGIWLSRRMQQLKQSAPILPDRPQVGPGLAPEETALKLKTLAGPERVEPTPVEKLAGESCDTCKAAARHKSGAWYRLQGQTYCQDCAREKAGETGANLVSPAATAAPVPTIEPAPPSQASSRPGGYRRNINLKPAWVTFGAIQNVEGYEVIFPGGAKTGLTITPEIKIEADGHLKINKLRWYVNYERAGRPIGGPYESVSQAKGMAALMAQFDWNRPPESFTKKEAEAITAAANGYRADIKEERLLKQRATSFSS